MSSEQVFKQLARDTGEGRGLPNHAFTSDAFLELENTLLFPRSWLLAGTGSDVPNVGDAALAEFGADSLILLHGSDEQIRVFHNVCPHRGARLLDEPMRAANALTCPYHAWSFDLDGNLKGRPHYDGPGRHDHGQEQGNERVCLFEVRSHQWGDWIFVNLDGQAVAFETEMEAILRRFDGYPLHEFRCAHRQSFEFACNWKLAVENYNDVYHVFKIHPALDKMHVASDRYPMTVDGRHLCNGYSFEGPGRGLTVDEDGPALPTLTHLKDDDRNRMQWATLFPNTAINIYPSNLQLIRFLPKGPHRTQMQMWFYFVGDAATDETTREAREALYREWANLNAEDEDVCRRMQLGRGCNAYDGGRFAPYWDSGTLHFHREVAKAVSENVLE